MILVNKINERGERTWAQDLKGIRAAKTTGEVYLDFSDYTAIIFSSTAQVV